LDPEVSTCRSTLAQVDAKADRVIAIFSHELRSHIAPIKNAAEMLQRSPMDLTIARRAGGIIERQVDGMTLLVDELLAFARSKNSQLSLRHADTVLEAIVRRGVEFVQPFVSARRHTLSIHMPAEPIYVAADESWLTRAVQNVLDNAVKYTDPGGRIDVDVRRAETDVEIRIRDTGIGLAAAELETVFDLYARVAEPAARPRVGGLGVGLHLARFVVAAHGGSIRATSDGLGRGSTFVIRLPCRTTDRGRAV
jgi:two-component system, sensor histidine kinase